VHLCYTPTTALSRRTLGLVDVLPGLVAAQHVVHLLALQRHLLLHLVVDLEQVRARLAEEAHAVGLSKWTHIHVSLCATRYASRRLSIRTSGSTSRMFPQHGQKCIIAAIRWLDTKWRNIGDFIFY
jgi:hypothetical protein